MYNQDVRKVVSQIMELDCPETIDALRTRHSEKPVEVRETIESLFPSERSPVKVELFSRHDTEEWISFGNQKGTLDSSKKITGYFKSGRGSPS